MKSWNAFFEGNKIRVENHTFSEKLYINGKLHDEGSGIASRAKLIGKLPDGKLVKVSIGGCLAVHCTIFVEDQMILKA